MNWLDIVLLAVVALAAVHGLRLGAAIQVLSFGGFWLGLFLGIVIAPHLAHLANSPGGKSLIAIVVAFGMAGLVGGAGRYLGAVGGQTLRKFRLGAVDSALGVGVAVVATLFAIWLVASMMVQSRVTTLASGIQHSRIVRALDSVLPSVPTVFGRFETFLNAEGFPIVFAGIPPQLAGPVTLPTNAAVRAAVLSGAPSTVQIVGQGCGVIQEGSGFVVSPGIVVTNAHVVAGIRHPMVLDRAGRYPATAIQFDPELDIAVLQVPGLTDPSLRLDPALVPRGTQGVVMGYPGGGPFTYGPAGVAAAFDATGYDIYGTSQTTREVYQLDAVVRPGNSGGPLVEPNGEVVGVVFARSTTDSQIGYALATPAVIADVQRAESTMTPTGTGSCAE
jgi:S1-C subfamily serine protease